MVPESRKLRVRLGLACRGRKEVGGLGGRVADVCDCFLAYVWMMSSVATIFVIGGHRCDKESSVFKVEPMG